MFRVIGFVTVIGLGVVTAAYFGGYIGGKVDVAATDKGRQAMSDLLDSTKSGISSGIDSLKETVQDGVDAGVDRLEQVKAD